MATIEESIGLYRQLAERHDELNREQERDRFMLLAADAAQRAGKKDQAEQLRKKLLSQNPSHLLKPFRSLQEALQSADIVAYIQQLRRSFPHEKAELILKSLPAAAKRSVPLADDFSLPLDADKKKPPTGRSVDKPPKREPAKQETQEIPTIQFTAPPPKLIAPVEASPAVFSLLPEAETKRLVPLTAGPGSAADLDEEDGEIAGGWVGWLLFLVFLIISLGMLTFEFVVPFVNAAD